MPANSVIQLRRGTAAQWTSANPVLANGEPGYETDTGKEKRGDGTTAWTSLAYIGTGTFAPLAVAGGGTFYAALQSGATADAKCQAALTACIAAGGGTVVLPSGTLNWSGSVPVLPPNLTCRVKIRGAGKGSTTVVLSSAAPRFLDLTKNASYDVLGNVTIEDLTVDCNNIGGVHHVIVGTYINNAAYSWVHVQNVVVRRVRGINAPVDTGAGTNRRCWVHFQVTNRSTDPQLNLTDVTVEDCEFGGGEYGVAVTGENIAGGGSYSNTYVDRVLVRAVQHDRGVAPTVFSTSANFHLVGHGFGGSNLRIIDCYGKNSGDVGVEIDSVELAQVRGTVIEDAWTVAFLQYGQNPTQKGLVQFSGCKGRRTQVVTPSAAGNGASGYGWSFLGGYADIQLTDCSWYRNTVELNLRGEGVRSLDVPRLTVRGFKFLVEGVNTTDTAAYTTTAIRVDTTGSTNTTAVTIRDLDCRLYGTRGGSAGNVRWSAMFVQTETFNTSGGLAILDVDNIGIDYQIANSNSNGLRCIELSTGTVSGVIRRLHATANIVTDIAPFGVGINSAAGVAIGDLKCQDFDFSKFPTGITEFNFSDATLKPFVRRTGIVHRNVQARTVLTVGGSPYTYQNVSGDRERISVQGGTVSLVELNSDGVTFVNTGSTGGLFALEHTDQLRVTYTVAPTMCSFPANK